VDEDQKACGAKCDVPLLKRPRIEYFFLIKDIPNALVTVFSSKVC
jgi:hypothetical protein